MTVPVAYSGVHKSKYVSLGNYTNIMGLEWLRALRVDGNCLLENNSEFVNGLKTREEHFEELKRKYQYIFEPGVGIVKCVQVRVKLREGSVPTFNKARPVPYLLLPKVGIELDRLERKGIIEKVERAEYATPLVVVPKPNGSLRLCADYKETLNKQVPMRCLT